jgi:hypothetical protein
MFKRKHKNIPLNAPTELWLKKSFDFVVPRSLEDYCSHIEAFDQSLFSSYRIYLSSVDQRRIGFTVSRSAGKSGTVWTVGYLETVDDQLTRIVGKAGIPTHEALITACIVGGIGLILSLNVYLSGGLSAVCVIGFFMALILLIIWGELVSTRDGLIDKLQYK